MPNLPVSIPRASSSPSLPNRPSSSIGRAQQIQIGKLQQEKDREAATTSIIGAIRNKEGKGNQGPTTSINRTSGQAAPSTSIFHPGAVAGSDDDQSDAIRDHLRYQHIRKMMKEKKEIEAQAVVEMAKGHGIHVGTGGAMSVNSFGGLKKTLAKLYKTNRSEFKDMSSTDKALLQKIIQSKAASKTAGAGFGFTDKRKMSEEAYKNYKSGVITYERYKHFKRVIDDVV